MATRRHFLTATAGAAASTLIHATPLFAGPAGFPRITFYGATRQVSGSCHLLETSRGLYLVDCGLFISDVPDPDAANRDLPFDPKDVKAVFLTHAHTDHNGRLPLLYKQGFRGSIYCTDATRDLTEVMLKLSAELGSEADGEPIYDKDDAEGTLGQLKVVPYGKKFEVNALTVRYTDAGHILGSAMAEIWVDGRKLLFSGDMGPDATPILCRPTQHFQADAVLVESTYGPVARDTVSYEEFGRRVAGVVKGGGSVLLPAFAIHKTQLLIYTLHRMVEDGILPPDVPIISDSSTAQQCTRIYDSYADYWDEEAQKFAGKGPLLYRGRYRELRTSDSLLTHESGPAIYISTSGMLSHAASPKHLWSMARDARNAVFIVGYQSPDSVGYQLAQKEKTIKVPWEEFRNGRFEKEERETEVKLQVEKLSGFSSHARGGQILDWISRFESIGPVYVVHGDGERSTGMADKAKLMGVQGVAPQAGETFVVTGERVKPGTPPELPLTQTVASPVDK